MVLFEIIYDITGHHVCSADTAHRRPKYAADFFFQCPGFGPTKEGRKLTYLIKLQFDVEAGISSPETI